MTPIYTLSIECLSGRHLPDRYVRIIETPTDTTLGDLHFLILDLAEFDGSDHLSGFYLANHWGGRKTWITIADDDDEAEEARLWDQALADLYPLPRNKKLYFLFDFGDSWIFEIRKQGREKQPAAGVEYPVLIHQEGPQLIQYESPEEDFQ